MTGTSILKKSLVESFHFWEEHKKNNALEVQQLPLLNVVLCQSKTARTGKAALSYLSVYRWLSKLPANEGIQIMIKLCNDKIVVQYNTN